MDAIIWIAGIVFSIFITWHIGNIVAGFSIVAFWIAWTLGLSSFFVGYSLGGPLAIFQLVIIIFAFIISYKIRQKRQKTENQLKVAADKIKELKSNLSRFDNKILEKNLEHLSNKEIGVLENPKQHRAKLLETLDSAQKTIVIFSGWITDYSVNDDFRNRLKKCLNRGVDIIIAWGYKKSKSVSFNEKHFNNAEKAIRELQEWTSLNNTKGTLETFYFPNHSKILICDTSYAIMGSFNWLSNSGGSENEERSYIIYSKKFIEEELSDIMKNLYDPKKPLSRRQLLKNFVPFSRY